MRIIWYNLFVIELYSYRDLFRFFPSYLSMYCTRCREYVHTSVKYVHLQPYNIQGDIRRVSCDLCYNFLAMKLESEMININEICSDRLEVTWKQVLTNRDKLIYYILSQIIYPEFDTPRPDKMESPYDFADDCDCIIVRWEGGKPVGFYTIKPKGTEILHTQEKYVMPVVDTAYIRSEYRSRGFGLEILLDVVTRFPNEDIGFSKPISEGMLKVLKIFLTKHKKYRLCFWEVMDYDITGSQQLVWCRVRD